MNDPLSQGNPELQELDKVVHRALEALLVEAKRLGITKPPFGRGKLHLPYDDYVAVDDEADDQDLGENFDENPKFEYSYGFNALRFVADYLRDYSTQRSASPAPASNVAPVGGSSIP